MVDEELWEASGADHSADLALEVRELAEAVATHDGVSPLNEQGLRILAGQVPGIHLTATLEGAVIGYAQIDPLDGSAQLFVHPEHRRQGVGRALLELAGTAEDDLDWWSFGTTEAARELADTSGLEPVRGLLRMALDPTTTPIASPGPVPEGITITTFTEADVDDLVEVNARAFADHPEQGRMTRQDVEDKMAEDWFDPQGLFLARDEDEELVGFHWTKIVHAGHDEIADDDTLVGEVYVIGVDPSQGGRGLGRHLLQLGLRHLAEKRVRVIELYVEANNDRVIEMYRRAGFGEAVRDTRWG